MFGYYKPGSHLFNRWALRLSVLFFVANQSVSAASSDVDISKLSLSDISYLWPVPKSAEDVELLLDATTIIGKSTILPGNVFNNVKDMALNKVFVKNAQGKPVMVPDPPHGNKIRRITFSDKALEKMATWKVVGFRVDPSAPSTEPEFIKKVGSIPQIRLILQPITVSGKSIVVHDYTMHLPYSFTENSTIPFVPNKKDFKAILAGLIELKIFLLNSPGKISTDGVLRVNQGLAKNVPGFREKIESFLVENLPKGNLTFVAFMGLAPRSEPWVFFDLIDPLQTKVPDGEMLFMLNTINPVSPPNPVTSQFGIGKGVSTAFLFTPGASGKLESPAIAGLSKPLNKDIPNIIANPEYSNVFNTDCVSCHSETTRRSILHLEDNTDYRYPLLEGVKSDLLPANVWNLRNFGWFTKDVLTEPKAFITMRTVNETANALQYIKAHY